jgi:hypothetical protein
MFKYPFAHEYMITQEFGEHPDWYKRFDMDGHNGIDFGAPAGTPVLASAEGEVITAEFDEGGYGNHVILDHGNGYQTVYAHLWQLRAPAHAQVKAGQLIGLVGNTGNSTGPHLHFEIRKRGLEGNGYWGAVDPRPLLEWPHATPEPAPVVPPGCMVNASGVRLRGAPGLGGAIIAELRAGTQLEIGDARIDADGHTWQEVRLWVAAEYLK